MGENHDAYAVGNAGGFPFARKRKCAGIAGKRGRGKDGGDEKADLFSKGRKRGPLRSTGKKKRVPEREKGK